MVKNMVKANIITDLTTFIMDNGNMIKNLEKEFINMNRVYIMDIGRIIKNMVKEVLN